MLGNELGERVEKLVSEVLASGQKQSIRYSVPLGGKVLWFEAVVSKRDDSTVVSMIRDVTREHALQRELEEQREFMENILNAISDPIFLKDEKHRWLYGNDAFSQLLGLAREQYYGKTDADFYPKEIANLYFDGDRTTFANMVEVEREETFPSSDGGEARTILTKKTPFVGLTGDKTLVGIIRDITDR
jgi:PAS domain S-box-containing protein